MLIFTFCFFVLSIGEDTADIQVMIDLLEDVIVFDQRFNRRDSKDGCVLTISCLRFMVWTMWFAIIDIRSSDI